jgi:hypothetical protein
MVRKNGRFAGPMTTGLHRRLTHQEQVADGYQH